MGFLSEIVKDSLPRTRAEASVDFTAPANSPEGMEGEWVDSAVQVPLAEQAIKHSPGIDDFNTAEMGDVATHDITVADDLELGSGQPARYMESTPPATTGHAGASEQTVMQTPASQNRGAATLPQGQGYADSSTDSILNEEGEPEIDDPISSQTMVSDVVSEADGNIKAQPTSEKELEAHLTVKAELEPVLEPEPEAAVNSLLSPMEQNETIEARAADPVQDAHSVDSSVSVENHRDEASASVGDGPSGDIVELSDQGSANAIDVTINTDASMETEEEGIQAARSISSMENIALTKERQDSLGQGSGEGTPHSFVQEEGVNKAASQSITTGIDEIAHASLEPGPYSFPDKEGDTATLPHKAFSPGHDAVPEDEPTVVSVTMTREVDVDTAPSHRLQNPYPSQNKNQAIQEGTQSDIHISDDDTVGAMQAPQQALHTRISPGDESAYPTDRSAGDDDISVTNAVLQAEAPLGEPSQSTRRTPRDGDKHRPTVSDKQSEINNDGTETTQTPPAATNAHSLAESSSSPPAPKTSPRSPGAVEQKHRNRRLAESGNHTERDAYGQEMPTSQTVQRKQEQTYGSAVSRTRSPNSGDKPRADMASVRRGEVVAQQRSEALDPSIAVKHASEAVSSGRQQKNSERELPKTQNRQELVRTIEARAMAETDPAKSALPSLSSTSRKQRPAAEVSNRGVHIGQVDITVVNTTPEQRPAPAPAETPDIGLASRFFLRGF